MPNVLCISHEWSLSLNDVRELSDAGFYLIPASNGFDAVKHFATRPIDAVVVNRRLPDIDVDDLTGYFRRHNPDLPIVMISNQLPVPDAPPAVDAIIQKHAASDLLVPTLQSLLDRTDEYLPPRKAGAEAA
jgi:DNA-binding NtrC family response regulator